MRVRLFDAGKYVVVPRAALAPAPYYISYWSALSYHDLTEQLPRGVFVAVCGNRKRALRFQGWGTASAIGRSGRSTALPSR